ncbi:MAG: hydrolase, partial [Ruminococcaceae bacterium]|nr:hydrolase [Oscillospiraceae bacterium]
QTALGVKPGWGTVAVDKSVIKLRSKVYVCNKYFTWQYQEGLSTAQDVGVKGNAIDLWMYNSTLSYKFGRRPCWVYLISEP